MTNTQPTLSELEEACYGQFYQYKYAAKQLFTNGYYVRGRNYFPSDGGLPLHKDIYFLEKGKIKTLCYNITSHRAKKLLKAHRSGKLQELNTNIVENYKNNGYMTRRGLFANYNESKTERIKKIAMSHADYAGRETLNSTQDHLARVEMRNN